ncbi:MAG: VTT domain-containing protein [Alcanivorax sp.]|nr:VTT domain-containing protein [Alcanivorax sp.]
MSELQGECKVSITGFVSRYKRLLLVVAMLVTLALVMEFTGLREQLSLAFLRDVLQHNRVTGVLAFILIFILGNLVQLPGWIFLAAAVLALGTVLGGLVTYVAACLSCMVTFVVVRSLGGQALEQIDRPLARRILDRLDSHPVRSVALLRLLFQTMPALNYTLALTGVRLREYMIGTLIGLPLPLLLYCLFFDRIARVLHLF